MSPYPTISGSGGVGAAPTAAAPATSTGGSGVIQGTLNYGANTAGADMFSGGLAGLSASYAGAYQNALQANQTNYNNILAGYQQTMQQQTSANNAITGGYTNLYNNVLGGIQGIEASQSQAINDAYAAQVGQTNQGLISSGLGNTTVQASVDAGLQLQQQKAQVALQNQFAATQAGYQSNLGLAGLAQQSAANQQNTALGVNQLNWMNSVNAPYPNAQQYAQLAQQYGATDQANQDRALQAQQLARLQAGVPRTQGGAAPGLGQMQPNPAYPSQSGGYTGGAPGGTIPGGYAASNAALSGTAAQAAAMQNNPFTPSPSGASAALYGAGGYMSPSASGIGAGIASGLAGPINDQVNATAAVTGYPVMQGYTGGGGTGGY